MVAGLRNHGAERFSKINENDHQTNFSDDSFM